jgi:NhaC family Na+:H+ antiporter
MTPRIALASLVMLLTWLLSGLFILEISLHALLLTALAALALLGRSLGVSGAALRQGMFKGVKEAIPALAIFLMIGVLMASFMLSGTVASLLYYGLKLLTPSLFVPATLVLTALMASATGTSWGTVATLGVALVGLGELMGIPSALVAGAAISGASFGDKMSPISDTTNLAALSTQTDLYRHIHSMALTTGPALLIAVIVFAFLGSNDGAESQPLTALTSLESALRSQFDVSWLTLTPIALMIYLAVKRVPAEVTMLMTSLVALVLAITLQDVSLTKAMNAVFEGATFATGDANLDRLLSRGGMASMAWTLTLALIAVAMGGILQALGLFEALISGLLGKIQSRGALVSASTLGATMGNAMLTEPYIVIILTGQLFKSAFANIRVDSALLSRSIEEGSTLTAALIPWTTTGIFYAATLDLAVIDYAPYAILNWLNPLIGIAFAWFGWGLLIQNKQ